VAERTIRALRVDVPANALAAWVAAHHPDLFLALHRQAQAAHTAQRIKLNGLRGLADGTTTLFDSVDTPALSLPEPGLQTITIDESLWAAPPNIVTDATDTGSSWLSSIGDTATSAGSSIGSTLLSSGSSVLSALGSVGSYLTSAQGLNAMTGLAKTILTNQASANTAQTQQAVLQAQAGRVATGQQPLPIRYTTNSAGQLVPVYATQTPQGAVYQPLSAQGIASLTPSSLSVFVSQYGLWLGFGALALWGITAAMRR
jgi:hypothetical protein